MCGDVGLSEETVYDGAVDGEEGGVVDQVRQRTSHPVQLRAQLPVRHKDRLQWL